MRHDAPLMTYLLVHGGGSTARFWDRLLPYLDAPALAVDMPGRRDKPADLATLSVPDEAASVVGDVATARPADPIVLVAHSSGGLVVPGVVAALGDRVGCVVLNAALVPVEGGRGIDCMKPKHRDGLAASVEQARARRTGDHAARPASRSRVVSQHLRRRPPRRRDPRLHGRSRALRRRHGASLLPTGVLVAGRTGSRHIHRQHTRPSDPDRVTRRDAHATSTPRRTSFASTPGTFPRSPIRTRSPRFSRRRRTRARRITPEGDVRVDDTSNTVT